VKKGLSKNSVLKLVQTGVLTGIIILMAFTPIGYIPIGLFKIALITIPVVVGAMTVGPLCGLFLGFVFGMTSFLQCFGLDAFGTALSGISPFLTFIMCVPTRMLMGWLCGVLFRLFKKLDKHNLICYAAGGICGALLNTIFFMGAMVLCFWNTDYIQGIASSNHAVTVLAFIVVMVGLNGVIEMLACGILGGGISKILNRVIKQTTDGEYV